MAETKSCNRMSIQHILCTPCDFPDNEKDSTFYGLPSPVSSYHSSDDDDDVETKQSQPHFSAYYHIRHYQVHDHPQHLSHHQRAYSDNNNTVFEYQHRAILPYVRRRCNSSTSNGDAGGYSQTRIPWSPDEDVLLKQGYEQGLSWAMIASTYLPHRSRGCCWGRFKTLRNKKFLNVQRRIKAKARPWKTLNPGDMQQYL